MSRFVWACIFDWCRSVQSLPINSDDTECSSRFRKTTRLIVLKGRLMLTLSMKKIFLSVVWKTEMRRLQWGKTNVADKPAEFLSFLMIPDHLLYGGSFQIVKGTTSPQVPSYASSVTQRTCWALACRYIVREENCCQQHLVSKVCRKMYFLAIASVVRVK